MSSMTHVYLFFVTLPPTAIRFVVFCFLMRDAGAGTLTHEKIRKGTKRKNKK
jgi:hypothetical protein